MFQSKEMKTPQNNDNDDDFIKAKCWRRLFFTVCLAFILFQIFVWKFPFQVILDKDQRMGKASLTNSNYGNITRFVPPKTETSTSEYPPATSTIEKHSQPEVTAYDPDIPLINRPLGTPNPSIFQRQNLNSNLKETENTRTFSNIYERSGWGNEGGGSGPGSSLRTTHRTRVLLEMLLIRLKVTSLIDVPCGAMVWMPSVLARMPPDFQYIGLDVVPSVIEKVRVKYPKLHFEVLDMSEQPLPQGYDAIHCRDALQHLPFRTIINTLENFCKSGTKFLIVGSYNNPNGNRNVNIGDYFDINLLAAPFSLPNPIDISSEETGQMIPEIDKNYLVFNLHSMCKKVDFAEMRKRAGV